jgi:hypothetical protein
MFEHFQILTHLPLMNLYLPPNSYQFFSLLFDISNYNIFPVDTLYQDIFPTGSSSESEDGEETVVYSEDLMYLPKQEVINLNF